MKVKATRVGFYGTKRRKEDEVFVLREESDFSPLWMKALEDKNDDEDFFEDEAPKKVKRSRPKSVSREEIKDDVL